jgi:hypothetical protein
MTPKNPNLTACAGIDMPAHNANQLANGIKTLKCRVKKTNVEVPINMNEIRLDLTCHDEMLWAITEVQKKLENTNLSLPLRVVIGNKKYLLQKTQYQDYFISKDAFAARCQNPWQCIWTALGDAIEQGAL